MLNLSDVRVCFVRHPISDATPTQMVKKAEESFEAVCRALESDAPVDVPDWVETSAEACKS